jgi:hypothetical protein
MDAEPMRTSAPPFVIEEETKSAILADIRKSIPYDTVAIRHGVPRDVVKKIQRAYLDVLALRKGGVDPRVLWANYRDLVTAKVCGFVGEDAA